MTLEWEYDPAVAIPLAVTFILYAVGLSKLWRRAGAGRGVTIAQSLLFASGWLSLVLALVSPLHEYAEHLFTAHMIEHEVLMTVAAPLLALSRPIGIFLHALPGSWRAIIVSGAHRKIIAGIWS